MKELRIVGPPGCGKSTRLATHEIPKAVDKYGPDKVVVTSFTRTAAKEIAQKKSIETGKVINIPAEHVGTLHKLCYAEFGQPKLAEKMISDWNEFCPAYQMSGGSTGSLDDVMIENGNGSGGAMDGDIMLSQLNRFRAKCVPKDRWPQGLQIFEQQWSRFKNMGDLMDFTDLIEHAIERVDRAPGNPRVIFVDEAQDFTRLQFNLIRKWAQHCEWLVCVGDADQAIFEWMGATPDAFLATDLAPEYKRVLEQSYRVPRQVHQKAMQIIRKINDREDVVYHPRDFEGKYSHSTENYLDLERTISHIEQNLTESKTVMFLASCSYMLKPLIAELKSRGIAFGNKYRKKRGEWNPFAQGTASRQTAADVVKNFCSFGEDGAYWTIEQLVAWARHMKVCDAGLVRKTGKKALTALTRAIKENQPGLHTSRNVLSQIFTSQAIEQALNRNMDWFYETLSATRQKTIEYAIKVYNNMGLDPFYEDPKLTVGTVHSVKGAESDLVILCPDISFKAENARKQSVHYTDGLWRLFYVGATRAKQELKILEPANGKGRSFFVEL